MRYFIALFISLFICIQQPAIAHADDRETLQMLDLFGDIFEKVRKDYVEETNDKELIEAAINGMLTSLDPHSSYLEKESFKEMRIQTKGEFGGLGIEVTMEDGLVKVVSPIDETPAHHAGVKAGDLIVAIDDESVRGMTLSEAVERMRGKPKTEITITILRKTEKEPLDITIVRDVIKIRSVRSRIENDVIYIRVTSFSETTIDSIKKAFVEHKKTLGTTTKGLVLDLRNNPGGLLDQAIAVSDAFLERGEIVSTRGRMKGSTKRFNATPGDIASGTPIIVLINGGSASASEIVAGALQDHKRAIILGEKSFGKGSVQTVIPVPSDGAIRLTTSRYYTPSGRSIQAEGIAPDIEIEPAKVEILKKDKNNVYNEASLRGHLESEKEKKAKSNINRKKSKETNKDTTEEEVPLYERDYMLGRAVDLLHGIYLMKQ